MNPQRAVHPSLAVRLFGGDLRGRLALLRAAWPLAVGAELARRTEVLEVQGTTLRVRVPDAAWRKVLHAMQPRLRVRLRDVAGDLAPARLSFQEAPLTGVPAPAADATAASASRDAPAQPADTGTGDAAPEAVRAGAAAIADPEIRERFLLTAARALARRPRTPGAAEEREPQGGPACE
jgi:hypothetical protein